MTPAQQQHLHKVITTLCTGVRMIDFGSPIERQVNSGLVEMVLDRLQIPRKFLESVRAANVGQRTVESLAEELHPYLETRFGAGQN